ncbi:probable DNA double-strand break repair Rad50 ATPase [Enoplosus armatus]|uniref:probable DNA double-strand break repair Rad50 ATPase n=1 Tax=Enoplosus armatus TaxID=215367 RepID=UPI0039958A3C
MEDMRRRMEAERKEREEKLRTAAKIMVLKEREACKADTQTLQRKLSTFEEQNRRLKADLHEAKKKTGWTEGENSSLHRDLSALEKKYDASMGAWWKELKKEREKAKKEIEKRDEQIISLQQSLHAQREETERMRASVDEWKESSGAKGMEERWQKKVSQLEEVLIEKDKLIARANSKRRARTNAHVDTLAQLNEAQSALKQSQVTCEAVEEKLRKQLAERVQSFQTELREREESFRRELSFKEEIWRNKLSKKGSVQIELSNRVIRNRKEISNLCESWERRAQQWGEEKRELEETLHVKEKEEAERIEEIGRLTEVNIRLQERSMEKQNKSFWSWSLLS